jgi:hypothetical protein
MSPDTHNKEPDRRSGIDRRQFSYALHIPERRVREERRRRRLGPSDRFQEARPAREIALSGHLQQTG